MSHADTRHGRGGPASDSRGECTDGAGVESCTTGDAIGQVVNRFNFKRALIQSEGNGKHARTRADSEVDASPLAHGGDEPSSASGCSDTAEGNPHPEASGSAQAARAPTGDRISHGRSGHERLSQPVPAAGARGVCRTCDPVERELKRRRIRGKQRPADASGGVLPSASGPAHSSAVDRHESSSNGPVPRV